MSGWQEMMAADVLTLGAAADEARRAQSNGAIVTFCRVHVTSAPDVASGTPVPDGASEVRVYATPATLEEAVAQVSALAAIAGGRRISAFSAADVEERGWPMSAALAALVAAGLDDFAEVPADRLSDLQGTLGLLREAGMQPPRVTISHPLGDRKAEVLGIVQEAAAGPHAIRCFAPLPRVAAVDRPTTGYDDVRMVAVSRLALGACSIEVDWTRYGPKLAQVALTFGADHLDAVPGHDDPALGPRRATVEDVERNIRAAGFEPQEIRAVRTRRVG